MPLAATAKVAVRPAVTVWFAGCVVIVGAEDAVPPVPVSDTACGLFGALSVSVSVPVRVPVAVGVNFTLIVQLTPAATELPQVPNPAKPKSPVKLALKVRVVLPEFVSVMNCAALLVPTAWLLKVSEVGERLAVGVALTVAANELITNNSMTSIVALKVFSLIFLVIPMSLPFQVCIGTLRVPALTSERSILPTLEWDVVASGQRSGTCWDCVYPALGKSWGAQAAVFCGKSREEVCM